MDWKILSEPYSLTALDEESCDKNHKAVLIFKHSTRCSISSMARSRMERSWNIPQTDVPAYLLDLIRHRDISNAIAERYGIMHESPQVLLIRDKKCIYSASHGDIDPEEIRREVG